MLLKKVINKLLFLKKKNKFKNFGQGSLFSGDLNILNGKYITIGDKCYIGPESRIEAWDKYNNIKFNPEIIIGNDVRINSRCHIGAINKIIVGNQCLIGSNVMIIDHSHGRNTPKELDLHPGDRDLYSKGPIIIGEKTWLCENVVVLPNVKIGKCCVIGANAVVTKNIPDYSIAVGNPAKIVKKII